ncbi:MAG: Ig-like domain-containing protein [Caldilineaceae bacterium]
MTTASTRWKFSSTGSLHPGRHAALHRPLGQRGAANGLHEIRAKAVDTMGQWRGRCDHWKSTIRRPTTPAALSIVEPADNISGTVTISAQVFAPDDVTNVEFYVDGRSIGATDMAQRCGQMGQSRRGQWHTPAHRAVVQRGQRVQQRQRGGDGGQSATKVAIAEHGPRAATWASASATRTSSASTPTPAPGRSSSTAGRGPGRELPA